MDNQTVKRILKYYPAGLDVKHIKRIFDSLNKDISLSDLGYILDLETVTKLESENKDPIVVLPEYESMPKDPTEVKITWFKNTSTSVRFPSDKKRVGFKHEYYKINCGTVKDLLENGYRKGYQCLSGGFYRSLDPLHKYDYVLRVATNLVSHQLYCLEIDDYHEGITCIEDVVDQIDFVRENAFAVAESVTGKCKFDVDGIQKPGVKFRIFFLFEEPYYFTPPYAGSLLEKLIIATEIATGLKTDRSGSNPTNGFMGRQNAEVIYLNNFVNVEILYEYRDQLLEVLDREREERQSNINFDPDADLDMKYIENQGTGCLPCPFQFHENDSWETVGSRNNQNATVVSYKDHHIALFCHKCKNGARYTYEGKRIRKNQEVAPRKKSGRVVTQPDYDPGPSWRSWTPELIQLARSIGIPIDASYVNGEPEITMSPSTQWELCKGLDLPKRRLWYRKPEMCDECDHDDLFKCIDLQEKSTYKYCMNCHQETRIDTLLLQELRRKAPNSIHVRIEEGYLSDNQEFQELELWKPGHITHIASPVRVGKSTAIALKQKEFSTQGFIGIIANPRTALVEAQTPSLNQFCETPSGYGQFHGNAYKEDRFIGSIGALCTISSLGKALSAEGGDPDNTLLAIDEIDFCWDLLNTVTDEKSAISIKESIKTLIQKQGIVLLGQTENYLNLEALCHELEVNPETHLTVFSNEVSPLDIQSTIKTIESEESVKKLSVASVIRDSIEDLEKGRTVLVFASGRVDCKVIAQELKPHLPPNEEPLIYTKYTKYGDRQRKFLENGKLTDTRLLVASPAIDVGVSIQHEDAVTRIVVSQNPKFLSGVHSIFQKTARNRKKGSVYIYSPKFKNAIPVSVSDSEFFKRKYTDTIDVEAAESGQYIVLRQARQEALNELFVEQSSDYYRYHLEVAGYTVTSEPDTLEPLKVLDYLKGIYNEVHESEKAYLDMAKSIIKNRSALTSYDLHRKQLENKFTLIPEEPMAHEMARSALQSIGWDGEVESLGRFSNSDLEVATLYCDLRIDEKSAKKKIYSYLAIHYPFYVEAYMQKQLEWLKDESQTIDRVSNYTIVNQFTRELLISIGNRPIPESELDDRLYAAFNTKYEGRSFADLMKKGSLGSAIAKKSRFLSFGKSHVSNRDELRFIREFLLDYYSVKLCRFNGYYKTEPNEQFETIAKLAEVFRRNKETFNHIDHENQFDRGQNMINKESWASIYAKELDQARSAKANGASLNDMENLTGLPKWFIQEHSRSVRKNQVKKDRAKELRDQNKTATEISHILGVTQSTAKKYAEIPTRRNTGEVLMELITNGANTVKLIASKSDLKVETIRTNLRKLVSENLIEESREGRSKIYRLL